MISLLLGLAVRAPSPRDDQKVSPPASQNTNAAVAVSVDSNQLNHDSSNFVASKAVDSKPKTTDSQKKDKKKKSKEYEPDTKP